MGVIPETNLTLANALSLWCGLWGLMRCSRFGLQKL